MRMMFVQVVAIMGPSGAGKTTLLYALMGTAEYGTTRGHLWINGREIQLRRLRRILGYVPQVCILLCLLIWKDAEHNHPAASALVVRVRLQPHQYIRSGCTVPCGGLPCSGSFDVAG